MIDQAAIKGEKDTGYEGPEKGPFQCSNCEYFRNGSCGQSVMMAKSKLPRVDGGRVRVSPSGCCEYIDRKGGSDMASKKWASGAFKNANKPKGEPGSTKGALHRDLNVPEGQTIPKQKLRAAAAGRYGKLTKKRALPVVNVQK